MQLHAAKCTNRYALHRYETAESEIREFPIWGVHFRHFTTSRAVLFLSRRGASNLADPVVEFVPHFLPMMLSARFRFQPYADTEQCVFVPTLGRFSSTSVVTPSYVEFHMFEANSKERAARVHLPGADRLLLL